MCVVVGCARFFHDSRWFALIFTMDATAVERRVRMHYAVGGFKLRGRCLCNASLFTPIVVSKNKSKFDETIKYIKTGVPIIEQAMLCNYDNKTYGVADLLIRSDYLHKIFKTSPLTSEEEKVKKRRTQKKTEKSQKLIRKKRRKGVN